MVEDLDLDELDQAVNNIMTKPRGKRAAKKPAERPAEPAADKSESITVSTSRPTPMPEPAPEPAKEEPVSRPAEPARVTVNRPVKVPERRRMHPGAMDIIQPSAPKTNAPSGRPGRLAAQLHPTQEIKPEPVRPVAPVPEPKPEPVSTPQPEPQLSTPQEVSDEVLASLSMFDEKKPDINFLAPEKNASNSLLDAPEPVTPVKKHDDGWPDPLDFHDFGDKHDPAPESAESKTDDLPFAEAPAEEPKETPPSLGVEPVSVTDRHEDAATVSSSPFVTTKVEKRPLGAFADAVQEPAKVSLPEVEEPPVPHESTSKGELAEASFKSEQHLDTPKNHDDFDPTDLRSMTIPPQYHTAEAKPKDDIHPLYDTKEYQAAPPHMHTAHKSSPALAISIVVLVVLILAALLVGYFMMTGTFDVTQLW